jgi:hypothetical protein
MAVRRARIGMPETDTRPLVPSFLDFGAVDFTLPCLTRSFLSPTSIYICFSQHAST